MISIIIPVYNKAKSLPRCIESIVQQSVTDWELWLVDDGSDDGSGALCDEYAQRDARIHVLHQTNGGPSAARNKGMDRATGEYITFIDADDSVSSRYLSTLASLLTDGVDVACVGYQLVKDAPRWEAEEKIAQSCGCALQMSGEEAMASMLYQGEMNSSPCAKLYRRSLAMEVRFDEKLRVYEDMAYTLQLLDRCHKVVIADVPLYAYYKNNQGIHFEAVTRLSAFEAFDQMQQWVGQRHPSLNRAMQSRRLSMCLNNLRLISSTQMKHSPIEQKSWKELVDLRWRVLTDHRVRLKNKLGILCSLLGYRGLMGCFRLAQTMFNLKNDSLE